MSNSHFMEGTNDLYCQKLPSGSSTIEVLRIYESSLKDKSFETSNGSCYATRRDQSNPINPVDFANAYNMPSLPDGPIGNYFQGEGEGLGETYLGINQRCDITLRSYPHPARRATFSRQKKSHLR